jgi:hypothetical protein
MPADRVSASIGYTIAMGDFEFMRFDFGIETDARDGEKAPAAMERAKNLVEKTLATEIAKAFESRNGSGTVVKRGRN